MPHRFSSSGEPFPHLREQARRHASTASACLRKLSDWVNSVSKHQASERIIPCFSPVSCGFLPPRWHAIDGFAQLFRFSPDNTLDSSRGMPQSTLELNVVPALALAQPEWPRLSRP